MSTIYINNVPFMNYTELAEYNPDKPVIFDAALDLVMFGKVMYAGSIHSETISGVHTFSKKYELLAGFHIKKPGIGYKLITVNENGENDIVLTSGVSTGEPIMFGNMYCEKVADENKLIYKNIYPMIAVQYNGLHLLVSEETEVDFYDIYLTQDWRRPLVQTPAELELFGKKYAIKAGEIRVL